MQLQDLETIASISNIGAILAELDTELSGFRALGEFPTEVHEEIQRAFLPERISDTLNIEGIRVNPRITRAILEGLTIAESDQYNEREILNVIAANELIEVEARERMPLTVLLIKELHRRVEQGLIDSAGSFRQKDVKITGAVEQPPFWADVPELVAQACDRFIQAADVHPLVRAAWLHATFTRIHPFEDGNGRTGRLLQDFALLSEGLLPVGVPASRRQQYYDALEAADSGEWQPLIEVIANSELSALDRARRIAEAPALRRQRVQQLLKAAGQTTKKRDYNRYEIWRRRVEGVRDEFARWAEELSADPEGLSIRVTSYDPVSFDKWKDIRARKNVTGTWLLALRFFVGRAPLYSFLFYARRHEPMFVDVDRPLEDGMVGIFLAGAQEPNSKYSFHKYADPYITLRELLFDGNEMLVFNEETESPDSLALPQGVQAIFLGERWRVGDGLVLPDVVERFYEDALGKLGLIS